MKNPRIDKHCPELNGREGGDNEGRSESRGYDGGGPFGSALALKVVSATSTNERCTSTTPHAQPEHAGAAQHGHARHLQVAVRFKKVF